MDSVAVSRPFPVPGLALRLAVAIGALLVVYRDTYGSMVATWLTSETFGHCFVILPVSLYLIWRRRDAFAAAPKRLSAAGFVAVLLLSIAWLLAKAANVQVGQQFAATLSIPAAVLALVGMRATAPIAFPLGYLLFCVPFGEVLIPPLMEFTADFTVWALKSTGIPVYREGFYFSIPSGDFAVAKACSGVRYLIACFALGVLYAHLSLRSPARKLSFIAISLIAPIVANGIRAYAIVMIAHLSQMRLAAGVDHLVYGWVFFAVLVLLLLWLGSLLRDRQAPAAEVQPAADVARGRLREHALPALAGPLLVAALAAAGPVIGAGEAGRAARAQASPSGMPAVSGWRGPAASGARWLAASAGGARHRAGRYTGEAGLVDLQTVALAAGEAEFEIVGTIGRSIDRGLWRAVSSGRASVGTPAEEVAVRELILESDGKRRVVWYWYLIDDAAVSADWHAKLLEVWSFVAGAEPAPVLVALSVESPDPERARRTLRAFSQAAFDSIVQCLRGDDAELCIETAV